MNRAWDVAIVGAGPAGAAAAIQLARAERRVLLLDKAAFPRDKVCGDALIPDALACLARLGLRERVEQLGYRTRSITVYSRSRHRVDVRGDIVLIKRRQFDTLLVDEAVRAGAVLRTGAVTDVERSGDWIVRIDSRQDPHEAHARIVIVATGADTSLAARAGLMMSAAQPSALALRCYVKSAATIADPIISFDESVRPGYAWIFPLGAGEYNVGCGVPLRNGRSPANLRTSFERFTRNFPLAREVFRHATDVKRLQGAMLRWGLPDRGSDAPPGLLPAGETIGSTFPFTGEGVGKAMETGLIAAAVSDAALARGDVPVFSTYEHRIARELRPRYRGYRIAEKYLSRGWLNDLVAVRASRSRYLLDALSGVLNETVDPRTICSIRGLLISLIK